MAIRARLRRRGSGWGGDRMAGHAGAPQPGRSVARERGHHPDPVYRLPARRGDPRLGRTCGRGERAHLEPGRAAAGAGCRPPAGGRVLVAGHVSAQQCVVRPGRAGVAVGGPGPGQCRPDPRADRRWRGVGHGHCRTLRLAIHHAVPDTAAGPSPAAAAAPRWCPSPGGQRGQPASGARCRSRRRWPYRRRWRPACRSPTAK